VGIAFHFINLDRKVYWHDEVYTSMRSAGFTRAEIDQELFQNRLIPAPELQKFQRIKPGSGAIDTIRSLATEDPQHPPLYFLMTRGWMELFGSSLTAVRLLPVLCSLLGLPLMYGLGLELFRDSGTGLARLAALLATTFLALSPFDMLFAQTARQYSLLTTIVIGSSWVLLRAMRLKTWQSWGLYSVACAVGFYTHPFFGLTLVGHGVYWLLRLVQGGRSSLSALSNVFWKPLLSVAVSLILFSPWLKVILSNYSRVSATTDWARVQVGWLYLAKLWLLSFTALFFDLDFGFDNGLTYALRVPIALLMGLALYTVCRRTSSATWQFILTTIFVPFFILALPDFLVGGKRSAVSRYLISCFPGVQLAMAWLVATIAQAPKKLWGKIPLAHGLLGILCAGSILSCTVSAAADTWWSKDLSYFNAEVARLVNATPGAIVLSDLGDDFTNTGDLISLSYRLNPEVRLLLLGAAPQLPSPGPNVLVFRPSGKMRAAIAQAGDRLEVVSEAGNLWRLRPS